MPTARRARHGRHGQSGASTVRLGQPAHVMERRRGELLALTYLLGDIGVAGAWAANPHDVTNEPGVAALVTFVMVAAATMFVLRHKLPVWVGDLAIVGSLVLIDLANLFTRLDVYPGRADAVLHLGRVHLAHVVPAAPGHPLHRADGGGIGPRRHHRPQ